MRQAQVRVRCPHVGPRNSANRVAGIAPAALGPAEFKGSLGQGNELLGSAWFLWATPQVEMRQE